MLAANASRSAPQISLMRSCGGLGALALLASPWLQRGADAAIRSRPKQPHHHAAPRSRSSGCSWKAARATSTSSTPSPSSNKLAGQPLPACFGKVITAMGTASQHADAVHAHLEAVRPERHLGLRLVSRTSPSTSTT